jgi:hypothetical protein
MSGRTWQDIPGWLIYAVRREHAAAMSEGRERAGEDAAGLLTGQLLRDDPEFARVIVTRYVRTLIQAPKQRKRTGKDRARDRERLPVMADCVRLSEAGLSLREIGEAKGLSHTTVRKLIAEWQTRLPEMPAEIIRLSRPLETGPVNLATAGFTPGVSADGPNVLAFRRPA